MKPVKDVIKEGFLLLVEGPAHNDWWTLKSFLHVMYLLLNRGAQVRTALYIFHPATGKDVFISVDAQKSLSKQRKIGYNATRSQFYDLAVALDVPWDYMYSAYIAHYLMPRTKWSFPDYPDTWIKNWKEQHNHAEVQCDSV